jgi:hypothetical protein
MHSIITSLTVLYQMSEESLEHSNSRHNNSSKQEGFFNDGDNRTAMSSLRKNARPSVGSGNEPVEGTPVAASFAFIELRSTSNSFKHNQTNKVLEVVISPLA